jgi:prophage regulatory protein
MSDHLLSIERPQQVWARLNVSPATGWRRVRNDPDFPRPVKLGPNSTGFLRHEVDAYIRTLAERRRSGVG